MKSIPRLLERKIIKDLKPQKAVFIFGTRRTGKTVIMKRIIERWKGKTLFLNGEDYDAQNLLENRSTANYRRLLNGISLLAIDEAQNIPDINSKIKLILDGIPSICILASKSSSFDSQNKTFRLAPFSQKEISIMETPFGTRQNLEERLIYGSYPKVVMMKDLNDKADYLREIANSFIYGFKNPFKIRELLRIIAFQLGREISFYELGKQLEISKNTVEKYLNLLSESFILFRLGAYSKNLKKEITKTNKWYFYDVGVRNALVGNFKQIALRDDIEALWKNYIISERLKDCWNSCSSKNFYFWRTYDNQESDFIEESEESGELHAYEINWEPQESELPAVFANAYEHSKFDEINGENYLEFV